MEQGPHLWGCDRGGAHGHAENRRAVARCGVASIGYGRRKRAGYRIEIIYLTLPSPKLALRRIAARVRQGGHSVPKTDVLRRFRRSWKNFESLYRPLADAWTVYDNVGDKPVLKDRWP